MQTIVQIKDGLWSNLAAIAFALGLAGAVVWLDHCLHGEVSAFVWVFAGFFVLFCYIPVDALRKPKSRLLAIEGEHLVWRVRTKEGEAGLWEQRIPLKQLRRLEFVIPRQSGAGRSHNLADAQLYFVTAEGGRRELPLDFFPGVYQRRIVEAIQQRVPGVQVTERLYGERPARNSGAGSGSSRFVEMRRQATVVIVAFFVVGVGLCVIGAILFSETAAFVRSSKPAAGRVVDLVGMDGYYTVFTFTDASGQVHTGRTTTAQEPPTHRIGMEVTVLYPPAEPGAARIQSFQTLWLLPTFISCFGLVMACVSAGAFVASRKA